MSPAIMRRLRWIDSGEANRRVGSFLIKPPLQGSFFDFFSGPIVARHQIKFAKRFGKAARFAGSAVAVAHDGPSGIRLAREYGPETVVCDIGLPGPLDGYAVARALRADPVRSAELSARIPAGRWGRACGPTAPSPSPS